MRSFITGPVVFFIAFFSIDPVFAEGKISLGELIDQGRARQDHTQRLTSVFNRNSVDIRSNEDFKSSNIDPTSPCVFSFSERNIIQKGDSYTLASAKIIPINKDNEFVLPSNTLLIHAVSLIHIPSEIEFRCNISKILEILLPHGNSDQSISRFVDFFKYLDLRPRKSLAGAWGYDSSQMIYYTDRPFFSYDSRISDTEFQEFLGKTYAEDVLRLVKLKNGLNAWE